MNWILLPLLLPGWTTVKMEVDEALGKLGTIGKWQILYYTMIGTACMVPSCLHMLAINYIGKRTTHSNHRLGRSPNLLHKRSVKSTHNSFCSSVNFRSERRPSENKSIANFKKISCNLSVSFKHRIATNRWPSCFNVRGLQCSDNLLGENGQQIWLHGVVYCVKPKTHYTRFPVSSLWTGTKLPTCCRLVGNKPL